MAPVPMSAGGRSGRRHSRLTFFDRFIGQSPASMRVQQRFVGVMAIRIGTAGWSIPRQLAFQFPAVGTSLNRYSVRFNVAEINSSFHCPHKSSTWERWYDSVPEMFRFSVKLPKLITHEHNLVDCAQLLDQFLAQACALREKLAVILVQLPPKLALDKRVSATFFGALTARTDAKIACEPRHQSWFTPEAGILLERAGVARVAADPAICEAAAWPGGWAGLRYWRLHGSPAIYRSSYDGRIDEYALRLEQDAAAGSDVWCIFDNTASSAGAGDALALMQFMGRRVLG